MPWMDGFAVGFCVMALVCLTLVERVDAKLDAFKQELDDFLKQYGDEEPKE